MANRPTEPSSPLLAPYRPSDLPKLPSSFWKLVGPGAVLVGLSVGAGELIIWPRLTAQYGGGMVWAAMLGIFVQMWLNMELGRYTLATGESPYTGFARVSPIFAWVFLVLNVVAWIVPGWARACGGALKALIVGPEGPGGPGFWTMITFAFVALTLFGPKRVYGAVEKTTESLVVLITVGLIVVAASVGTFDTWAELAAGAVNIGYKHPDMPGYEFFSAIVFAGAGGTANLFYCFYLRDKGWGMGGRMPVMVNALREREETSLDTGFEIRDTAENRALWSSWFKHLIADQVVFFWILNSLTILLFIFGALAVLYPAGIVPSQETLIWDEASILAESWGTPGRIFFLLVGVACLFSTQLTLIDGVSRSLAEIFHANFAWAQKQSTGTWYTRIAGIWIVAGILLTYAYESLPAIMFLLGAGFFGGIAMAIYAPLILFVNLRYLPDVARPSRLRVAIMALISVFYGAFAVVSVLEVGGKLLG